MRVILHADDLGISQHVNDAIFRLIDQRKLTSASILANGPAFEDAVERAKGASCSFGVHLNITEFRPRHATHALQAMLGPDGSFKPLLPIFIPSRLAHAIGEEWSAQVRRVRESGIAVTHIDSHHHAHTRPSLFSPLLRVCREHRVRRVRICQTFQPRPDHSLFRIDRAVQNWRLRRAFDCPDESGPFAGFADHDFADSHTVEVVLHPGHRHYLRETELFERHITSDFVRQHDCISYGNLN